MELFSRDRFEIVEKKGEINWVESITSNENIKIKRDGTDNE